MITNKHLRGNEHQGRLHEITANISPSELAWLMESTLDCVSASIEETRIIPWTDLSADKRKTLMQEIMCNISAFIAGDAEDAAKKKCPENLTNLR